MADTAVSVANKPAWIDLSSADPEGSRKFYAKIFGWQIEVDPDPQYGGYAMAKAGGKDVAGIGPQMSPGMPTAWTVYIGTDDAERLAKKVQDAGGKVVAPPMQVGDHGKMAVFQDPTGAFIAAWQPQEMGRFNAGMANSFGWAELTARGIDKATTFYRTVFGWLPKTMPMGEGQGDYTEFLVRDESIAGGMEMSPQFPPEMPSYWLVYFSVDDIDATHRKALGAGAKEMLPPTDFPGGRFSIVTDPQGAAFGIIKFNPR